MGRHGATQCGTILTLMTLVVPLSVPAASPLPAVNARRTTDRGEEQVFFGEWERDHGKDREPPVAILVPEYAHAWVEKAEPELCEATVEQYGDVNLLCQLPVEVREVLSPLPSSVWWGGLQALHRVPDALELATTDLVLFALLATAEARLGRELVHRWMGRLLTGPRRELLKVLALPKEKRLLKALRKVDPGCLAHREALLEVLRHDNPQDQKILAHLPSIDVAALKVLTHPALDDGRVSFNFVNEVRDRWLEPETDRALAWANFLCGELPDQLESLDQILRMIPDGD